MNFECFPSGPSAPGPCQPDSSQTAHTRYTPQKGNCWHLTACTCMFLFTFPAITDKHSVFRCFCDLHRSNASFSHFSFFFFLFRRLTGQVKIQDFSVIKKMDPSVSASHFPTLKSSVLYCFFTVWSQHQFNKSDQLTIFSHRCLYFWITQRVAEVWVVGPFYL